VPRTGVALTVLALAIPFRTSLADDNSSVDSVDRATRNHDPCLYERGVVGHRKCPAYGVWGAALESPYASVTIGLRMRHLPSRSVPGPAPAAAARSTSPTPTPTVTADGGNTSYTVVERLDIAMHSISYIGFEFEISPLADERPAPGSRQFAAGSQAVLGLRGGFRRLKLAAELAAGVRMVDIALVDAENEAVLEARVRGQLWLTPWFTIGGLYGSSLLDRSEWLGGIEIGVHTYSWGGF